MYKRLMNYNWQRNDWPSFHYDLEAIQPKILQFAEKTGRADGLLAALPDDLQTETIIDLMVAEAVKSSAIEGEMLSRPDVMSSIKNNLGLPTQAAPKDKRTTGIAELMVRVRNEFKNRLSKKMLCEWHSILMQGSFRAKIGSWRTHAEPMLIVSGTMGSETIHYEAPPSTQVPGEMKHFVEWFNRTAPGKSDAITETPVRAAIAHLYFESIHPFEDGNGRIGRAIAEKALSQGLKRPALLSLSQSIEAKRADYYAALKQAQRSVDITDWIEWFTDTLINAQQQAEENIEFTLRKVKFFDRTKDRLNTRQLKAIKRMLKSGVGGFQGGMSSKKYMAITKTSKATATRDLQDLVAKDLLIPSGGGRSVRYEVNL